MKIGAFYFDNKNFFASTLSMIISMIVFLYLGYFFFSKLKVINTVLNVSTIKLYAFQYVQLTSQNATLAQKLFSDYNTTNVIVTPEHFADDV